MRKLWSFEVFEKQGKCLQGVTCGNNKKMTHGSTNIDMVNR